MEQSMLLTLVGSFTTLLPEEPPDLFVPSKWIEGSTDFESTYSAYKSLRREAGPGLGRIDFDCRPGEVPMKTGTPWPADPPPPWGMQRDGESDYDYRMRVATWATAQPLRRPVD